MRAVHLNIFKAFVCHWVGLGAENPKWPPKNRENFKKCPKIVLHSHVVPQWIGLDESSTFRHI